MRCWTRRERGDYGRFQYRTNRLCLALSSRSYCKHQIPWERRVLQANCFVSDSGYDFGGRANCLEHLKRHALVNSPHPAAFSMLDAAHGRLAQSRWNSFEPSTVLQPCVVSCCRVDLLDSASWQTMASGTSAPTRILVGRTRAE